MNTWVLEKVSELLSRTDLELENLNDGLRELRNHSLKMVMFLAEFSRQFGKSPKIVEFIQAPCIEVLQKSIDE